MCSAFVLLPVPGCFTSPPELSPAESTGGGGPVGTAGSTSGSTSGGSSGTSGAVTQHGVWVSTLVEGNGNGMVDGPPDVARLSPFGLVLGADGDLYFTDVWSVRKVDMAGNVSTVAGSNTRDGYDLDGTGGVDGTAAFNLPMGIVGDGAGNLYVTDTEAIRKIDANGNVTSVTVPAGWTQFDDGGSGYPDQSVVVTSDNDWLNLARDRSGTFYVGEAGGCEILAVYPADGGISTFAGLSGWEGCTHTDGTIGPNGTARFTGPQGLLVARDGDLYVTDSDGSIRKISLDAGTVSTLVGPGTLETPSGLADDTHGNLYVTDLGGYVWMIDPQGRMVKLAGTGAHAEVDGWGGPDGGAALDGPFGVVVGPPSPDGGTTLFVADCWSSSIRKLTW